MVWFSSTRLFDDEGSLARETVEEGDSGEEGGEMFSTSTSGDDGITGNRIGIMASLIRRKRRY